MTAQDVVARTELPGEVDLVNVAHRLSVPPGDLPELMKKREGEAVEKGEVIAASSSFFGLFKSACESPSSGTIESISAVTGQVVIRRAPIPVEVRAYIDGRVAAVMANEGVAVETPATFIQGIFGIGGERSGPLAVMVDSPTAVLEAGTIGPDCAGRIVIGGARVTRDALRRAAEVGVAGVIAGGVNSADIDALLGYPLGVAITGHEDTPFSLMVTEGFGAVPMAGRTMELLRTRDGDKASLNGATQIRAGVIRPEVIIPYPLDTDVPDADPGSDEGVQIGDTVRIIREPMFGELARVVALPSDLVRIDTEAYVRVLEAQRADGSCVILPRANIEVIR